MRTLLTLNNNWTFIKNCSTVYKEPPKDGVQLSLPHTWNGSDGQDGGNDYFRGNCCYVREITRSELPKSEYYYLEFCGANATATAYLNGTKIGEHKGGYSTWRINVTEYLRNTNILTVIVNNADAEDVYPQFADFTFYGGLYRDVRMICLNEAHFDLDCFGGSGFSVTTKSLETDAKVEIRAFVTGIKEDDRVRYRIFDKEGALLHETKTTEKQTEFTIENVTKWHGKRNPYLYTAEVSILREDSILDQVSGRFGCRSFSVDPERGFLLNGEEYPLRGVSRHQDWPEIGNALKKEHHDVDMALICELGATAVRLAHYQHDGYFYDLCDERGIVVWAEIPYISRHVPEAKANAESQLKELIVQNYNHPSIVVWGLSNEITMSGAEDRDLIEHHKALNRLAHEMDSTRLTAVACLSMCPPDAEYVHITDLVAYNHYFGWYGGDTEMNGPWFDRFHNAFPQKPVGVSEYGCEALNWHSSAPKQGDYTEEYQAYYHERLILQLFSRPYLWSTFVWNMFDFASDARSEGGAPGKNHKGLVTMDRKYKKDAFYAYKAWLSKEPFVHLCGKRYVDRTESEAEITVYSNLPEVQLFANGVSVGTVQSNTHFFRFTVKNEGKTFLHAIAGPCTDDSVIQKVFRENPDYTLKETGTVLNWFEITAPEGYFSLNDTISDILKTDAGRIWFAQIGKKLQQAINRNDQHGITLSEDMMKMLSGFTVLRLTALMSMADVSFTKEQLLELNRELNEIKKAD